MKNDKKMAAALRVALRQNSLFPLDSNLFMKSAAWLPRVVNVGLYNNPAS